MMLNFSKSFLFLILISVGFHLNAQEDVKKTPIDEWELPRTARDFISMNFPEQKIHEASRIEDGNKKEFETILDNDVKIEFDNLGYWKEVDGNSLSIPTGFIPKKITDYLTENHPKQNIKKIEKNIHKYDVELMDGTDFEFNLKGRFVKKGE